MRFQTAGEFFATIKAKLPGDLSKDIAAVFLIAVVSVALRLPAISSPNGGVLDEAYFKVFAVNTLFGRPFFEPHPPLSWMIFSMASAGTPAEAIIQTPLVVNVDAPFGDFPYVKARLLSLLFGALIPILLFAIGRFLSLSTAESAVPALLAAFESGLIIHSRTMMPESLMAGFGLMGIVSVFLSFRSERNKWPIFAGLAGVLFGLSVAVKWFGLGFLAAGILLFLARKNYKAIFFTALVSVVVYFFVLLMYFNGFNAGPVNTKVGLYKKGPATELVFPGQGEWLENMKFSARYSLAAFNMHASSTEVWSFNWRGSRPYLWPIFSSQAEMGYWSNRNTATGSGRMVLRENKISWLVALIAIIVLVATSIAGFFRKESKPSDEEHWLVLVYAVNFVPFLFINFFAASPTWLFHYFSALCFSFLMIPFAVRRLVKDEKARNRIYCLIILGAVIFYFYLMPYTYAL